MCIICVWFCHIHVDWRVPFVRGRYEGSSCYLTNLPITSFNNKLLAQFTELLCYSGSPNSHSGFSKRKAEWSLRRGCICHQQHLLCHAISDSDHFSVWNRVLFHGPPPPRLHALSILCAVPIRKCHRGWEPHDGHSQCGSQFPDGHHHRSRNSGTHPPTFLQTLWIVV